MYLAGEANHIPGPFTEQEFSVELIDVELQQPWDLEFLPDGTMLVTEREGRIVHIQGNTATTVYELEPMLQIETGLMGLATDPDFLSTHQVYIAYTYSLNPDYPPATARSPGQVRVFNKVSRFSFSNGRFTDEVVLLDGIDGSAYHSGGRLEFGPDGKLYVTTGDAEKHGLAQNESFLGGKILRLNRDGSIPDDNPFPNSYVYSRGHRNPQGLAWHPVTKELYASEHGPWRYDEINLLRAGNNYGWGSYKCHEWRSKREPPERNTTTPPVFCADTFTLAPSGMEFVSDPKSRWFATLFVASLRGSHLRSFQFDNGTITREEIFFVSNGKSYLNKIDQLKITKRLRDVEYYDGSLYVIGYLRGLVRITPSSDRPG